jgi:hypothetical protein
MEIFIDVKLRKIYELNLKIFLKLSIEHNLKDDVLSTFPLN